MNTNSIALFVEDTLPTVQGLAGQDISRSLGDYHPDQVCSLGAHLAHHFRVSTWDYRHPTEEPREKLSSLLLEPLWDSDRGRAAAALTIDCAEWQVDALLLAAGAPLEPFISTDWSEPNLVTVWRNLAQITEFPPAHATAFRRWLCAYHRIFGL